MMNYLDMFLLTVKLKVMGFLKEEKGASEIVAIVVLLGIAVLLAIVFKDEIGKLITKLLETITGNATNVVDTPIQ